MTTPLGRAPVTSARYRGIRSLLALPLLMLFVVPHAAAQWSAEPGETVRNAFGPTKAGRTPICRGACGLGCPDTCAASVRYECTVGTLLRRVEVFECNTHLGCREHDDCLDACSETGLAGADCQSTCHQQAVETYGMDAALAWASGKGPVDGAPIRFEYTRDAPGEHEPAYRCLQGARRECDAGGGRCVTSAGSLADPVFDSFPAAGAGAMRVSEFRAGRLCGDRVCEPSSEIRVTGEDTCKPQGEPARCTRYGMEFDFRGADPSVPLECHTTTTGGKRDFVGELLVKGLSSMQDLEEPADGEEQHGMRVLLDVFKKVVTSADRPEDVRVSIAPLGPDGKPIESQRIGSPADAGPPSAPRVVPLPAPSGHLVIPMYELLDEKSGDPLVREIRCTHRGVPVLESTFRLVF